MISIIIRTKNEERWIGRCLKKIKEQTIKDYEIILVDNYSEDSTIKKARLIFPKIKIVMIKKFLPGLAINKGVEKSKGIFITILSAHCIPTNKNWLKNLLKNFNDPQVAGVYGRQVPFFNSNPIDKRDLLITFGLDKKIQKKDYFFHNANSMIRRSVWNKIPFDSKITNIEDRAWAKKVLAKNNYLIIYEPEAAVLHFHGIHQNNKTERLRNVVKIMEDMKDINYTSESDLLKNNNFNTICLIPIQSNEFQNTFSKKLLIKTIEKAKLSKNIKKIYIVSDDKNISDFSKKKGINYILRPKYLSSHKYRLNDVYSYAIKKIEKSILEIDIVVTLEIFYPFRPNNIIDLLINKLIKENLDTVLVGSSEYGVSWKKQNNEYERIDSFEINKQQRDPLYFAKIGFASVSYIDILRRGNRIGNIVGLFEINEVYNMLEIKTEKNYNRLKKIITNKY